MAQDWYYKLLGEETGPVTFQALRELAADGHLGNSDEIRTSTSSWRVAADVPELFQQGEVEEPELATGYDLDLLLTPSSAPTKLSEKRKALLAAKSAANAPPPSWYYKVLGQELGPVSAEEILEQIQSGALHADDVAKDGVRGVWTALDKTPRFAEAVAATRPQPEWYCRVLGQELGPMSFDELEAMAKSGALNADDEVRFGSDPWTKADRTRGLKFSKSTPVASASHDRSATYIPFGDDAKRKEWFYEILGQEMGPISFREMLKAVTDGTLAFEDKARKGKAGAWNLVMDVPGLVSTDAKAAYLAAKQEAARPKVAVAPPASTTPAESVASPSGSLESPSAARTPLESPSRSVVPNMAPTKSVVPSTSSPSGSYSGGMTASQSASGSLSYGSGMGGMTPPPPRATATVPPPPPAFKAPKKSSGPAIDFGAMFSSIGELLNPKAIGAVAVILIAGGLIAASQFGLSFGVAGKAEYQEVKDIWSAVKAAQQSKDFASLKSKYEGKVKDLDKRISSQGPGASKRLLQLMYFAAHNHLPVIIAGNEDAESRFKIMEGEMQEAAKLAGDTGI